ncbi:penicillin acylase family protein [Nocardioides sp.]|uniref:penicillin acylase family protein n=1 Tax=Nocardioides sp. TaxID=35761 RepID=UPI003518FBFC
MRGGEGAGAVERPGDGAEQPTGPTPRERMEARWRRRFRWAAGLGVVLALVLVAASITAVIVARHSWPETSGRLAMPGLESEVRVVRDDAGVPQIYASSMRDLMMAQGFVHAQDRFFEMDVRRHATAGRLAEMFGADALPTDLVVRTLGWRRVAQQELLLLKPATRSALDAYAAGVNAYLAGRSASDISLEYTLLGLTGLRYDPEDWTAVDSLAWLKAMAWDLRGNLDDEIDRALTGLAVGEARADELYPAYPYDEHPPIVGRGGLRDGVFDQDAGPASSTGGRGAAASAASTATPRERRGVVRALASARSALDALPALLGKGDGIGSNAWVVSGDRTRSGKPILANDPHLGISLPGVWSQVGLHCTEVTPDCPMDVAGFGFSGVPGVVIGHNRDIAWGFTNFGPDVTDLFVERVAGDTWQYDGRTLPLTRRTETVKVRGGDPIELTVRSTSHGPLLSDLAALDAESEQFDLGSDGLVGQVEQLAGGTDDTAAGWDHAVSLAWTALTPRPTADALLALDVATDWRSFRAALADFAVPGQNIVYADTRGHIGYQATGVVPVRRPGNDGRTPSAGWLPRNDWTDRTVPYDALPRLYDPASGVISTANQAVIDPERYAPFLTDDWDYGYRSTRIGDLLREGGDELDVDDMARIQLDARSAIADDLVPRLLAIDLPPGYYSNGQRLLRRWDRQQRADSAAAAYFNVVWRRVLRDTFGDELPAALQPDGSDRWFRVVSALLKRPDARWWDDVRTDGVTETRDDVLRTAMLGARDELTARQSPRADEWTWGGLHRLELRSSTLGESGIGVVESIFNRGGWEVGGGSSIVDATGWNARQGYEVTTAPSMRMIVPMDDLDAARWINLTGVSGHAYHPHYTDQTDVWARGDTLPWRFGRRAVEAAADDVLVLQPPRG